MSVHDEPGAESRVLRSGAVVATAVCCGWPWTSVAGGQGPTGQGWRRRAAVRRRLLVLVVFSYSIAARHLSVRKCPRFIYKIRQDTAPEQQQPFSELVDLILETLPGLAFARVRRVVAVALALAGTPKL